MKKKLLLCSLCVVLAACSAGERAPEAPVEPVEPTQPVQQEAEPFRYRDAFGLEHSVEEDVEILQRFVYARKSSGYFVDNVAQPALFDEEGFHGDWEAPEAVYDWRIYEAFGGQADWPFSVGAASSVHWVNAAGDLLGLGEQRLSLNNVTLRGFLRQVTETEAFGSVYALNYFEGELYFYPDPAAMGGFPMMILESPEQDLDYSHTAGGYAPLLIRGDRSSYQAWADTIRIKLEPLPEEQLAELFADSDLIEVEITFSQVDFLHAYEYPLSSRAWVERVEKLRDL